MIIVVYILLALLALKCLYNLTIPYTLLGKMSKDDKSGISFMPYLDAFLLVMLIAFSCFAGGNLLVSNPKKVTLYGIGAVAASYLHLVLVMIVGGWLLSRKKP